MLYVTQLPNSENLIFACASNALRLPRSNIPIKISNAIYDLFTKMMREKVSGEAPTETRTHYAATAGERFAPI